MKRYQDIPEVVEYMQLNELLELANLAKYGIREGNSQIELCKEELKTAICDVERENILLQIKDIQQHIYVCQETLRFFTHELKSLVYLLN